MAEEHYEINQPAPLNVLDDTKKHFTWRQVRTLLISSTGFFMDAYDIFIINLVTPMLGYVYYKDNNNKMPSGIQGPFKGMVSFGQLCGQLTFGFLGDAFGRKAIYGLELGIIILATINCATAASAAVGVGAVGFLGFWRFFLGFGIGGDYPMSSTVASEWASAGRRGQMVSLIFAMQGVGQVAAALVTMILLAIFKGAINSNVDNLDYVWRICIGFGAVPAVMTIYGRLTLPESPRYSVNVKQDEEAARHALERTASFRRRSSVRDPEKDRETHPETEEVSVLASKSHFAKWKNLKVLLGCSLCWFFMDIAFYGTNLNQAIILSLMGFAPRGAGAWDTLFKQALGNLILSLLGALPGYFVTVFLIERIGRLPIQYTGFVLVGVLFIILGAAWTPIRDTSVALFIVLFAIAQFFFNFGPNSTTFVLPAEVFPTRHRAKAHGIASASGKLGAIIATFCFNVLADVGGPQGEGTFIWGVLIIFGCLMLICVVFTHWIPETKGKSLDYFESLDDQIGLTRQPSVPTLSKDSAPRHQDASIPLERISPQSR
ncbi:phosphate transporter [Syncephalastrum racemosum]|uniref:Phosphate transporter n=1 Tax=Syncephalastrum racemosum TaxID=13706 RepID=A0A1X2H3T4_SYNRA|nr:phosphate transporter [Syncephalastrum racemosum]